MKDRTIERHRRQLKEFADVLNDAFEKHGFLHGGQLCLPFADVAEALLPQELADPPLPDLAVAVPVKTPESFKQLIEPAEANRGLFLPSRSQKAVASCHQKLPKLGRAASRSVRPRPVSSRLQTGCKRLYAPNVSAADDGGKSA